MGRNNIETEVTPCASQALPYKWATSAFSSAPCVRGGWNQLPRLPSEPEMCKLICADGRGALSVGGKNWDPLFLFSQWWLKVFPILGELQNVGSLYLEFPLSGPPSSFSGCSTHAGMGPLLCCSWSLLALEVLKVSCTSVTRASSWHSWWLSLFWSHSLSCHHYRVEWGTLPVKRIL